MSVTAVTLEKPAAAMPEKSQLLALNERLFDTFMGACHRQWRHLFGRNKASKNRIKRLACRCREKAAKGDVASWLDRGIERTYRFLLDPILHEFFPERRVSFCGEEEGPDDPLKTESGLMISVDPIDGTENVTRGGPTASTISLFWKYEDGALAPLLVITYDLFLGRWWRAVLGDTCRMGRVGQRKGRICRTNQDMRLGRGGALHTSLTARKPWQNGNLLYMAERVIGTGATIRIIGCTSLANAYLATPGFNTAAVVLAEPAVDDALATSLLVHCAGGVVTKEPGKPLIAAANAGVHQALTARFAEIPFELTNSPLCIRWPQREN